MSATEASTLRQGDTVGAYRVIHQIGAGGMGEVWLAEHTMLRRRAAIKVLHASLSMRSDIVTRFFNEARASTAISDPGIVQVFDFGHHVDGSAYIVMEMLDGETLASRLARFGPVPVDVGVRILRQVAHSLGAAHAVGIVHRDLKPENIFLVPDPEVTGGERPKILDFGIAKLTGDPTIKTQTSAVMGTPTYMSPEQCRGAGLVDQRSDVYALGAMLFTVLTGAPPFEAEGIGEIIAMHLREAPPRPSSRAPWIPPELDDLILRCLAKDPAQRFASGHDLARALGAMSSRLSGAIGPSSHVSVRHAAPTTLSAANGASPPTVAKSSRGKAIGFSIVGALAIGGGIVWATQSGSSKPPAPSPATAPVPPPPPVVLAAPPPEPTQILATRMTSLLSTFSAWSKTHAGSPCPEPTAIGPDVIDAWGHAMRLTCTDQPANQIAGAVSAGPDGLFETQDDIGSWQLPHDVTDVIRGPRWPPVIAVADVPPPVPKQPAVQPHVAPQAKRTEPHVEAAKPEAPKNDPKVTPAPPKVTPTPVPAVTPTPTPAPVAPANAFAQMQQKKLKVDATLRQAHDAAAAGNCPSARDFAMAVWNLDHDAYRDRVFADAGVVKCLKEAEKAAAH